MHRPVLVLLLLLVACKGKSERPPEHREVEAPPPERSAGDAMFVIGDPTVTRTPPPRWVSGPLPASVAELRSQLPNSYVKAGLRDKTGTMRGRLVDALTRAAKAGPIPEQLAQWYVALFGYGRTPEMCTWIVEVATGPAPEPVRAVFWDAIARCDAPTIAPYLGRDDIPDDTLVDIVFELSTNGPELPFNKRIVRAAENYMRASENPRELRTVGFVFAAMSGPESIAAFVALQKSIPDSATRARIAIGMLRSRSPVGVALGKAACKHPDVVDDAMCDGGDARSVERGKPPPSVLSMIRDGEDLAKIIAAFPRAEVIAALAKCSSTGKPYERHDCVRNLATLDRPAAVAIARKGVGDSSEGSRFLGKTLQILVRYPEAGALEAELLGHGFTQGRVPTEPSSAALGVESILAARGRLTSFDTETGQFPNEHDELLADLAGLAAPALDGVVFEEGPPPESKMDEGPYTLHAYADGKRYTVTAKNYGDWYDVEASLGLVNALLVARRSPFRLVALPTGDQTATVIAGPATGIRALIAAKLIELAKSDEGMHAGKEFEDRVFEQLNGSGSGALRDVWIGVP